MNFLAVTWNFDVAFDGRMEFDHMCKTSNVHRVPPFVLKKHTWMSQKVRINKRVITYNLLISAVCSGYNPLILIIDPKFQRDIQVALAKG